MDETHTGRAKADTVKADKAQTDAVKTGRVTTDGVNTDRANTEDAIPNDAGAVAPPSRLPATTTIGSVTLAVADLERTAAFYRTVLGLELLDGTDRHAELGVDGQPLIRLVHSDAPPRPRGAPGLYHLALLLPGREALGGWLRFALDSQVRLQGAADHAVSEAIYLADPEGNGIEVYRDRPRSAWRWDAGAVYMTTAGLDAADLLAQGRTWRNAPAETRIGHVHLEVSDLQRSTTFFEQGIGFTVTSVTYPGARFLSAGGYHHHIGLNTWGTRPSNPSAPPSQDVLGLRGFELVLPNVAAIDEAERRLKATDQARRSAATTMVTTAPDGATVTLVAA